MGQVARVMAVGDAGAGAAVQNLLWELMQLDVVQGLLVPLRTRSQEAPAPTLIKTRERLEKADPLAPVMMLNSAKIVGLLLAQGSGKRLAAVVRPCEARALVELAKQDRVSLGDLIIISVDCLGSHTEDDYEQRVRLWGDNVPTRESLRWSRRGQIASYRFRQACQMCERPNFDDADIVIGLFGQNVSESILVFMEEDLAEQVGLLHAEWAHPASEEDLLGRHRTIQGLVIQRQKTRRLLLDETQTKAGELTDLLTLFGPCTLCGECIEACPLSPVSGFAMHDYTENTTEYLVARLVDLAFRSESCVGCGICEAVCHLSLPLMRVVQLLAEHSNPVAELMAVFGAHSLNSNSR